MAYKFFYSLLILFSLISLNTYPVIVVKLNKNTDQIIREYLFKQINYEPTNLSNKALNLYLFKKKINNPNIKKCSHISLEPYNSHNINKPNKPLHTWGDSYLTVEYNKSNNLYSDYNYNNYYNLQENKKLYFTNQYGEQIEPYQENGIINLSHPANLEFALHLVKKLDVQSLVSLVSQNSCLFNHPEFQERLVALHNQEIAVQNASGQIVDNSSSLLIKTLKNIDTQVLFSAIKKDQELLDNPFVQDKCLNSNQDNLIKAFLFNATNQAFIHAVNNQPELRKYRETQNRLKKISQQMDTHCKNKGFVENLSKNNNLVLLTPEAQNLFKSLEFNFDQKNILSNFSAIDIQNNIYRVLNQAAKIYNSSGVEQYLTETIKKVAEYALLAHDALKNSDYVIPRSLANCAEDLVCAGYYTYLGTKYLSSGLCKGATNSIKNLAYLGYLAHETVKHPKEMIIAAAEQIYKAGYWTARVAQNIMLRKIAIDYLNEIHDKAGFKQMMQEADKDPYDPFKKIINLCNCIENMSIEDYGKVIGEITTDYAITLGMGKFAKLLKHSNIALKTSKLSKNTLKSLTKSQICKATTENLKLGLALSTYKPLSKLQKVVKDYPKIYNKLVRLEQKAASCLYQCPTHQNFVKNGLTRKGKHAVANNILKTHAPSPIQQKYLNKLALPHKFNNISHLFELEVMCEKGKKLTLSGFHHDYKGLIKNSGVLKYTNIEQGPLGCWRADVWYNGFKKHCSFFPDNWDKKRIIKCVKKILK